MKAALMMVCVSSSLVAQTGITVTVVNERGEQLVGAYVDHLVSPPLQRAYTDQSGKAPAPPPGQKAVVRMGGYKSAIVTFETADATVTLQTTARRPVSCAPDPGRKFGVFSLPQVPGIRRFEVSYDDDYSTISFTRLEPGLRGWWIRHFTRPRNVPVIVSGSGPTWSFGIPPMDLVDESARFEEDGVPLKDFWYADARGVQRDGTHWRFIGTIGESISYERVSKEDAEIFDTFMDRICVRGDLLP